MVGDICGFESRRRDKSKLIIMEENLTVTQIDAQEVQIDAHERASVDIQVATAKRFPRDIIRATNNAIAIVTTDVSAASSCGYALPRGGKTITGPSVHLAKILAQQFGNIRAEAKVVQITPTQIVSRGIAWDLENNYAAAFEVRRSIVDSKGRIYNADMITVTGNAANAIAYRNAVFAIVPKPSIDKVYMAAQRLITGDLSTEEKIIAKRSRTLSEFKNSFGISEDEILKLIGKETIAQIQQEQIVVLVGMWQALKDGDTTVSDLMKNVRSIPKPEREVPMTDAGHVDVGAIAQELAEKKSVKAETPQKDLGLI